MDAWLQRVWYGRSVWGWLLWPLTLPYWFVVRVRRAAYRWHLLPSFTVQCPVVVVGNISVGGTGKTPLVIWLARELSSRGHRVAVITRGYRGKSATWPVRVNADTDPHSVGDEAVLIARSAGCMVVAGPDRVADAREAITMGASIVISDDGLQHYRLRRDFEIAVVDSARGFGNRRLLPAGPLRESVNRLKTVQAVVATVRESNAVRRLEIAHWHPLIASATVSEAVALIDGAIASLDAFRGQRVHALAGIGHPDAFFRALRSHGIEVDAHGLPDHASLSADDLRFADSAPVLMTEKDAVKCAHIADARCWAVPLRLEVSNGEALLAKIDSAIHRIS